MALPVPVVSVGATRTGEAVQRLTVQNDHLIVDVLTWGATIQRLRVKGADGVDTDMVLGYPTLADYEADRFFLGAVVGRYANRIANGRFDLDGTIHRLPRNDAGHTLHGGQDGFHRQVWKVVPGQIQEDAVVLEHVSGDGTMGFPGRCTRRARTRFTATSSLSSCERSPTDPPWST